MYKSLKIDNGEAICTKTAMALSACDAIVRHLSQAKLFQAIMNSKSITSIMVQTVCVGLGEMDDMLLKKVEELTLYLIELRKENVEQAKEINELKLKLDR